jgi:hypothetical protein
MERFSVGKKKATFTPVEVCTMLDFVQQTKQVLIDSGMALSVAAAKLRGE